MTLCAECTRYAECREICPSVKKEITGRGRTASKKPRTYTVDFMRIEDARQPLNFFQREVLDAVKNISSGVKQELFTHLEIEEAINRCLKDNEKELILLFMQNYKQGEIARNLNISQPRVNILLQRAAWKIRRFLKKQL